MLLKKFLLVDPSFGFEKNHGFSRIGHVNTVSKIIHLYLGTDITLVLIHTSNIYKNTLHDLTLIKILVACSVGAGAVLIRYFNGYTKHI